MAEDVAIQTVDLRRNFVVRSKAGRFRRTRTVVDAVDGISMTVDRGEMVGYVGPNGAGKSTTIKMMTGILVPTSGTVSVAGVDPSTSRIELASKIGVVFGQRSALWWDLPLADSFDLLHHIYRTKDDRHRENLAVLVELLDVGSFLGTPVRQLSLGQRMRGELVAALLHDPELLFLDEPTIGLDVVSRHAVRAALADLNRERGVTVVLTTHDMSDIEELCPRMLIIDHGRVIYDGGVAAMRDNLGRDRTLVVDLTTACEALVIPNATTVRVEGPRQWLRFSRDETSAASVLADVAAVATVSDLSIEEPDITEIIRRVYTQSGS